MEENVTWDGNGGLNEGVNQSWVNVVFPFSERLTACRCLETVLCVAFIQMADEHTDRFVLPLEPFWSDDEFVDCGNAQLRPAARLIEALRLAGVQSGIRGSIYAGHC